MELTPSASMSVDDCFTGVIYQIPSGWVAGEREAHMCYVHAPAHSRFSQEGYFLSAKGTWWTFLACYR